MAGYEYELRMVAGCDEEFSDGWLRAENGGWGLAVRMHALKQNGGWMW